MLHLPAEGFYITRNDNGESENDVGNDTKYGREDRIRLMVAGDKDQVMGFRTAGRNITENMTSIFEQPRTSINV